MRDFIPSDGDVVKIQLGTDGKTLHIRDNHTVDSATHQEGAQ
jgi:hypothetical protein